VPHHSEDPLKINTSKQVGDAEHLKVFANVGCRGNMIRGK
jgi:hypothetical protein